MTTRRDFLTITVVGGAAAALTPPLAYGAPKSMTVARESSWIVRSVSSVGVTGVRT